MPRSAPPAASTPSQLIDARIAELDDWRGRMLAHIRALIRQADPAVEEEWKWRGVPVWSDNGIICTGETYKSVVKLTFLKGAALEDPAGLFNASLEGNARRAIDLREGDEVDAEAFRGLIRSAVALNRSKPRVGAKPGQAGEAQKPDAGPVLLSGGNPQIAKGDGDAPVQAYIAAMPGWKRAFGQSLDAMIVRTVPDVRKAVRWNSPFYGMDGGGWFLSFHVFTHYVKVTFFNGLALRPVPPGGTERSKEARWIDVHEGEGLDEAQMADWIRQAARLPGWIP